MTKLWSGLRTRLGLLLAIVRPAPDAAPTDEPPLPAPHPWEASYPDGLSWDFEPEPKPVFALLDEAVAAWPKRPCLEFLGRRYSYAEIGDLVDRAAKGFRALGVAEGVRVGLFLPNSTYYVICYYAILKAGGTVVNFNPLYAGPEIARQIRDSQTRIMVTMNLNTLYPKIARRLEDTGLEHIVVCAMSGALNLPKRALFMVFKRREVSAIPNDTAHVKFARLIDNDGDMAAAAVDPARDVAVLQYTGGTTGTPKGAMLTHANLTANAAQTRMWATDMRPGEEKIMAVLPLFHVFGMTGVMNVGLSCGAELLLMPRFKTSETLAAIDRERPTVLLGVPTIYSAINEFRDRDRYNLSSLRYCISGGAPLPIAIKTKFEQITGCVLVEGYGLTEAGPVCTINPFGGLNKPGSAGLPLPGTLVEIMSLTEPGRRMPLGEPGEIWITGPQVMAGYWNQDEETAAVLRDGRLRTGDVGTMDTDGYVYVIDRIKDLIISGGFNVYPRMVEEAIYQHPAVAEAAVCGGADKHRGEIVMAFIRLNPGATLSGADLRGFLKDLLAPFEIPRKVEFVEEIPKTLVGKPLRRALVGGSEASPERSPDGGAGGAGGAAADPRRGSWRRKAAERERTPAR